MKSLPLLLPLLCLTLWSPPALPAQDPAGSKVRLPVLPEPDLSGLEDAVAEQLRAAREILDERLAESTPQRGELAEAFGSLGRHYQAYELFSAARASYQNALILAPNDYRWNYLLGHVFEQEGDLEQASYFYQRAGELRPEEVPPLVRLAEVRQQQGSTDEAVGLYRKALELDATCAAVHAGLGQVALSERRYPEAILHFQAALASVPEANLLHYPLALAFRGLGQAEEAQRHLARRGEVGVRVADPLVDGLNDLKTGEVVYLLMGRRAFQAGDAASAAQYFRRAVEAAPNSFRAHTNLGAALAKLGEEETAIEHFRKAVEAGSESTSLHYNLAVLLNRRGDHAEAASHLEFILDVEPGDLPARLELVRSLQAQGNREAAAEQLGMAVARQPADEDLRLRLASLQLELERFEAALAGLEEANRLFPSYGRTAHALARLLVTVPEQELRDGQRALPLARTVFEADPTPHHAETLALALAEVDRCEEAVQLLEEVIAQAREAGATPWVERLSSRLLQWRSTNCES